MKDVKVLELDKYEIGIIVNALNEFRNHLLEAEEDSTYVDEVLLKVIQSPLKRRMFPRKYAEER